MKGSIKAKEWQTVRIEPMKKESERKSLGVRALKRAAGVVLIVVAVMFGGFLSKMNVSAAFATVFAYISAQVGLWM